MPVLVSEDVESITDLAAVGPADSVVRQLKSYLDAGATDVVLSPLDRTEPSEALWRLAASF